MVCRPVISDPGQLLSARQPQTYRPGMKRGSIRTLHDTKSVGLMFTAIDPYVAFLNIVVSVIMPLPT